MIKAVFFDIDGTLIDMSTRTAPASTIAALKALREKGIPIFIATGRPPIQLDYLRNRIPVPFDGFVTLNGQYCYMGDRIIRNAPIPAEDLAPLLSYLPKYDVACSFSELKYSYLNVQNARIRQLQASMPGIARMPIDSPNRFFTHDTYQLNLYLEEAEEKAVMAQIPNCRAVRWHPAFSDVIPRQGGKGVGVHAILSAVGIDPSEAMAFGDGGNDIEMLTAVRYSVAMGNANEDVKKCASYVTADIMDDGLEKALHSFQLLP